MLLSAQILSVLELKHHRRYSKGPDMKTSFRHLTVRRVLIEMTFIAGMPPVAIGILQLVTDPDVGQTITVGVSTLTVALISRATAAFQRHNDEFRHSGLR